MCFRELPRWLSGKKKKKKSTCQCRSRGFDSWVRKIPWRRKWQPTPVFLPGKCHGQRSLAGYIHGAAELDMTQRLHFPSFPFLKGELSTIFCGLQYLSYDRIYSSSFPKVRCKLAANPCAVLYSVMPNSLRPQTLQPSRLFCP